MWKIASKIWEFETIVSIIRFCKILRSKTGLATVYSRLTRCFCPNVTSDRKGGEKETGAKAENLDLVEILSGWDHLNKFLLTFSSGMAVSRYADYDVINDLRTWKHSGIRFDFGTWKDLRERMEGRERTRDFGLGYAELIRKLQKNFSTIDILKIWIETAVGLPLLLHPGCNFFQF